MFLNFVHTWLLASREEKGISSRPFEDSTVFPRCLNFMNFLKNGFRWSLSILGQNSWVTIRVLALSSSLRFPLPEGHHEFAKAGFHRHSGFVLAILDLLKRASHLIDFVIYWFTVVILPVWRDNFIFKRWEENLFFNC